MNTDRMTEAAAFVRADLDNLDHESRAGLGALAELLDYAGSGLVDVGDLGDHLDTLAARLIDMKADDELAKVVRAEIEAAHKTSVETVQGYLNRWVCTCGDAGEPNASHTTATYGAKGHVDGLTRRELERRRAERRAAVPA